MFVIDDREKWRSNGEIDAFSVLLFQLSASILPRHFFHASVLPKENGNGYFFRRYLYHSLGSSAQDQQSCRPCCKPPVDGLSK
jgi:hypothetical protein